MTIYKNRLKRLPDNTNTNNITTQPYEDRYRWVIIFLTSLLTLVIGGVWGRQTVVSDARQAVEKVNKIENIYNTRLDNMDKNIVEIKDMIKTYNDENRKQFNILTGYIVKQNKVK